MKIPRKLKKKFKAMLVKSGTEFYTRDIRIDELTPGYFYQNRVISFRNLSLTSHRCL